LIEAVTMKIASVVFFVMLALMAMLGSVLMDQSAQTARELVEVKQSLNQQLLQQQQLQQEQLAQAKSRLDTVSQELAQLKQVHKTVAQESTRSQQQIQSKAKNDKQAALLTERQKTADLTEFIKQEKTRIHKAQQQIDAARQQLDADEKSLDLELLAVTLENRLQKKLNTLVTANAAQSAAVQNANNAPLKGVDQYGEAPYRPPVAPVSAQPVQSDNQAVAELTARKNSLFEERKKLWAKQRVLDEDKLRLEQSQAQLKQRQEVSAKATSAMEPTKP